MKKKADFKNKVATINIDNVPEIGIDVRITANAKGKEVCEFNFKAKKLKANEIGIENVTFDGQACAENATIEVEKTEGDVKVTFMDVYEDLQVLIKGAPATFSGKIATAKVANITFEGTKVSIIANAKDKESKVYSLY